MILSDETITEIFYLADTFGIYYHKALAPHLLEFPPKRKFTLSVSEVTTLLILFHYNRYRTMKGFYPDYVKVHMCRFFPNTVSYNRFVELMAVANLPLAIFVKICCIGSSKGNSFIDSTPIRVCKTKRISRNKVFEGIAGLGKSTMGFFFGFKLYLVVNDKGEILNFVITRGNVDDRQPLKDPSFIKSLYRQALWR